ncbi:unnamed protein product, partial [Laminaria digitata]
RRAALQPSPRRPFFLSQQASFSGTESTVASDGPIPLYPSKTSTHQTWRNSTLDRQAERQ